MRILVLLMMIGRRLLPGRRSALLAPQRRKRTEYSAEVLFSGWVELPAASRRTPPAP